MSEKKKEQWGKEMVLDKDINDPKRGEEELNKALEAKALYRRYKDFMADPKILPIYPSNRNLVIPAIEIDKMAAMKGPGGKVTYRLRGKQEIQDEVNKASHEALPIVAFDPKLLDMTDKLKEGQVNYALIAVSDQFPVVKQLHWRGMNFWFIDYHNIVAFVDKENLSLLTKKIPESQIEKQREIEQSELKERDQVQQSGT
tara:strand:- start:358 stop:957 length:600 start_codon:yes stop_codon:yes gene_type:complete